MRQTVLIGRLTAAVDVRTAQTGTPFAEIELLVREKKGETWEDHRFPVTVYGESAKRIARQAVHGSEIVAVCKPESREYRGKTYQGNVASWIRVCMSDEEEKT